MLILSLDTETTGVDLKHSCRPFLVTVCDGNGPPVYWQWKLDPLTRRVLVDKQDLLEIAERIDEADELVFQNAKFDYAALISVGLKWKQRWWKKVHDTLYSGHILGSGDWHDLTSMAIKYLGVSIQKYEDKLEEVVKEVLARVKLEFPNWLLAKEGVPGLPSLKGSGTKDDIESKKWKWDCWVPGMYAEVKNLPADHKYHTTLPDYANTDSAVTQPLRVVHKELLERKGLTKLYEERRKLIRVVCEMEAVGVTYNEDRRAELLGRLTEEELETEKVCISLSGGFMEALPKGGTSNALRAVCFDYLKLPILARKKKKKKKTDVPSIDKTQLEVWQATLDPKSKEGQFIANFQVNRAANTHISYGESYKRFGLPLRGPWVKLHPSFNTTGSSTLRFSSERPNGQNISKHKKTNLRYLFGPVPGRAWWALDYSNLELTIPAYEANEREMIDLFERPNDPPYFGSFHLLVCHILYPKEFEYCLKHKESFKDKYKDTLYQWTKNGDFALTYGAMEEYGTADLAYHMPGAHGRIKSYLKNLTALNNYWIDFGYKHGYVLTMPDKEVGCGYPLQVSRNEWGSIRPTTCLNYHVQGTAMWAMCKAMVRVRDYLEEVCPEGYITLQVHDELVLDLPADADKEVIIGVKERMEQSGQDIDVPLRVEVAYHPNNWAEKEDICLETAI